MILSIIVAMAENRAIGKNGDLIWHNSRDLKQFKKITSGHTVIMGYKTYMSLPGQKALPNRRNIILSTRLDEAPEGFEVVSSIAQALDAVKDEEEVFIMGGGMVYEQFLPYADRLYLKALDHLNPTHEYGVAFERGTRVSLPGKYQYFISGTASINNQQSTSQNVDNLFH